MGKHRSDTTAAELSRSSQEVRFSYISPEIEAQMSAFERAMKALHLTCSVTFHGIHGLPATRSRAPRCPLTVEQNGPERRPLCEIRRRLLIYGVISPFGRRDADKYYGPEGDEGAKPDVVNILEFGAFFSLYFHNSASGWESRFLRLHMKWLRDREQISRRFDFRNFIDEEGRPSFTYRMRALRDLGVDPAKIAKNRPQLRTH